MTANRALPAGRQAPPPDPRQAVLDRARRIFGFIPNLFLEMSTNPAVADAYLSAMKALKGGALTSAEQHVVMLAISSYNDCRYCTAAHRTIGRVLGVAQAELDRITSGEAPTGDRTRALVTAAWMVMDKHGWLDNGDLAELGGMGVDRDQLYEIISFVGLMTISNYINHIHGTELDEVLLAQASRPGPGERPRGETPIGIPGFPG